MTQIEQARRELFEAWWRKENENCRYCESAWRGFNAVFDVIEIKLPEFVDQYDGWRVYEDCRAAIEQTGLGIKTK